MSSSCCSSLAACATSSAPDRDQLPLPPERPLPPRRSGGRRDSSREPSGRLSIGASAGWRTRREELDWFVGTYDRLTPALESGWWPRFGSARSGRSDERHVLSKPASERPARDARRAVCGPSRQRPGIGAREGCAARWWPPPRPCPRQRSAWLRGATAAPPSPGGAELAPARW